MKDTLESIVADILKVPERNVASVISSDLNHAHIDFFATKPSENARDLCESGKMPPKLWRALQKDPEISPLLENQKGNFNYFYCKNHLTWKTGSHWGRFLVINAFIDL